MRRIRNCIECGRHVEIVYNDDSGGYHHKLICSDCHERITKELDFKYPPIVFKNKCNYCNGKGKINVYSCIECNGSGIIKKQIKNTKNEWAKIRKFHNTLKGDLVNSVSVVEKVMVGMISNSNS